MVLASRSFIVLALVMVLGIAGQWSAELDSQLWRIPAAAWLLAVVIEAIVMHRMVLAVRRDLPKIGFLGRTFKAALYVHNSLAVPLFMETADRLAAGISPMDLRSSWRVGPASEARVDYSLTPQRLGEIDWQRMDARVLGRFRLAWWRRRISVPAALRVMPDHLGQDDHRTGSSDRGQHARPTPGSGSELFGLRDYQPGDPLRDIDWKATARRGEPMVKIRQVDEAICLVIAIDCGRTSAVRSGSLTRLGHNVNVASRLAEQALSHGDQVALVTYAETALTTLPAVRGNSGLIRIREQLAALSPMMCDSLPVAAALAVRGVARQRSLVLMLTDIEEGEASAHLLQATRLLVPRHLPLIGALADEDMLAMRWRSDGHWQTPFNMLAALELNRDARRARLQLERAGARVVHALPSELDERVRETYALLRRHQRV